MGTCQTPEGKSQAQLLNGKRFPPPGFPPLGVQASTSPNEWARLPSGDRIWNFRFLEVGPKAFFVFSFCFVYFTYFHFRFLVQEATYRNALSLFPLSADPEPRREPRWLYRRGVGRGLDVEIFPHPSTG